MLILKSASPRRSEILANLGLQFNVVPSDVDEAQQPGEIPEDFLKRVTMDKLLAGPKDGDCWIASDTIVVFRGRILQKPADMDEAARMLAAMSGHAHEVISSVGIWNDSEILYDLDRTKVVFKKWTDRDIEEYIERCRPFDKAGSYGIQDENGPVGKFSGSYTNVMGFPLRKFFRFHPAWSRFLG